MHYTATNCYTLVNFYFGEIACIRTLVDYFDPPILETLRIFNEYP